MTQLTDNLVWSSCLKGDRMAFAELYRRYYPLLYNYGCKFCQDRELVKDCIQNFFAKLILNYKTLSDTKSVKGYLLLAFRNKLFDALKLENAQKNMFLPCIDDLLTFTQELATDTGDEDPADEFVVMQLAFRELSLRQQEILYLFYIQGINHADIAEILNINYQSSRNLLFRSLLKLKELFFARLKEESCPADSEEKSDTFSHLTEKFRTLHVRIEE